MSETKTKNLCTVPAADLTDSQYFIAEDGGELKRIPKAQVVLKKLENMLATDTENLAGGGEVTAQELLDALAEQVANKLLAKSQVVNNLLATVEGNPLDATQGKALKELIDTTNNNLSNTNSRLDTSLSSSVLDYALTLPEGLHAVQFPGTGYTGTDLPKNSYMYSSATISVRSTGKIATVLLFGISKNCPLAVNSCEDGKWKGWDQYVTKDDIPTRYGGTGIEIPVGKSCKISITKDGLFAALLFVQGTTGSGFGTFMIQGYGVEGGPSRYRVNSLNTSGTQSGITCTVGDRAYFMVKNGTDNKVKMVLEEFFNDSTFTHSII
ncbi:MAG: hypothetical protein ACLVGK_04730 [Pilosibacter sp.]|jgi:hypothetical protein